MIVNANACEFNTVSGTMNPFEYPDRELNRFRWSTTARKNSMGNAFGKIEKPATRNQNTLLNADI
jgi:hypothetical protein